MNKSKIILFAIIIVAIALRFWSLGTIPASPDFDEAALGYNAYSILHTGRDEFGSFFPFVLRSFNDYKPALYSYFAIPSIAVFGLTVFAIRFPSAVFGVVGVLVIYLLVKELFGERENKQNSIRNYTEWFALLSAFLLAISPWQIQFSRTAFETNVGLTFNLLVGLFFLKGLKRPWMLLLAALFAGLNLSVYQSERVFTPLLVLALIINYRKELFTLPKKYLVSSLIIGLIVILPMIQFIFTNPGSLQRAQGTSIFSQQSQLVKNNDIRLADDSKNHDQLGMIFDNRRIIYAKEIIGGYLSHFDLNWLFLEGDNPRHHAPNMGLLYLINLPFLLLGIYFFLFGKYSKKTKYVIFSWLILAPVPASITFEVPHAVRTMNLLPMLLIFIAIGYVSVFQIFKKYLVLSIKYKVFTLSFCILFFIFALFNFTYYLNQYFVQLNYFDAKDWQYGFQQAIPQVEKIQGQYKKIIISNKIPMDQSYIFFLFYLRYPPRQYQQLTMNGKNQLEDKQFGKYIFKSSYWYQGNMQNDVLYVGSTSNFLSTVKTKDTIYYPDGKAAILLVDHKDNP